jgi:transcription elongation factor
VDELPFVAPASIPVTNARWAKRKTMKTGAIATSVAVASSGQSTELTPPSSDGLNAAVLSRRYCRPTGSGYCLSFQNIT